MKINSRVVYLENVLILTSSHGNFMHLSLFIDSKINFCVAYDVNIQNMENKQHL